MTDYHWKNCSQRILGLYTKNWGIKVCHLRKKFDSARALLLKGKILPAELFLKKFVLLNLLTSSHNIKSAVEKPKTPHSGFLESTN